MKIKINILFYILKKNMLITQKNNHIMMIQILKV